MSKDTNITAMSAAAIAAAVRSKDLSPTEVIEAVLKQMGARGALNAFVTVCADEALARAREIEQAQMRGDELGPLAGVPFSAKDLIDTAGIRTTYGSRVYADNVPATNAVSIDRSNAAGAILIGKTTSPEFGHRQDSFAPLSGRTLHPTHPHHTPGASSSGAAVAVRAGMGPLALGTDGGGSGRIPASCCGIVGMKPTLGAIPHLQTPDLFGANSYISPMTRDVADLRLYFNVLAGFDPRDPYGQAALPTRRQVAAVRGLRVAWLRKGGAELDPEVASAVEKTVARLEAEGAVIEEIVLDFSAMEPHFLTVLRVGLSARHGSKIADFGHLMDPSLVETIAAGQRYSADELADAAFARSQMFLQIQEVLTRFDVILSPTLTAPPLPIDVDTSGIVQITEGFSGLVRGAWYPFTFPLNLTGHPAISLSCGTSRDGRPIGMQIFTSWHQDRYLIDVAELFEACLGISFECALTG